VHRLRSLTPQRHPINAARNPSALSTVPNIVKTHAIYAENLTRKWGQFFQKSAPLGNRLTGRPGVIGFIPDADLAAEDRELSM
jgi:hypothetical protein